MISIDTNVLVRYLVQDDAAQGAIAAHFLETQVTIETPGYVSIVAVLELDWVLRTQYGFPPPIVRRTIAELIASPNLVFEQSSIVEQALRQSHPDLADTILRGSGAAAGCTHTVTFDKKFAREADVLLLTQAGDLA